MTVENGTVVSLKEDLANPEPPIVDAAEAEEANANVLPHAHVPHNRVASWREFFVHVAMIAIGVLLALVVEEWREHRQQMELASEMRGALRAEIIANRDALVARMRRTAHLYALVQTTPEKVQSYVFERRNRPLVLNDAAWTMTINTGSLRWLTPTERANITQLYTEQRHARDLADEEMSKWTDLAAFDSKQDLPENRSERERVMHVWLAFAERTQLAECATAGRYERALGARVPLGELIDFCASVSPEQDPAAIYADWKKRGWASAN
jgi:hypothetical protein